MRPGSVRPWLTVAQAAAYVQVGRKHIYRSVAKGDLQATRIDGRGSLRFKPQWLDQWLERGLIQQEEKRTP